MKRLLILLYLLCLVLTVDGQVSNGWFRYLNPISGETLGGELTVPTVLTGPFDMVPFQHGYTPDVTDRTNSQLNIPFRTSIATQTTGHFVVDFLLTTNKQSGLTDGAMESLDIYFGIKFCQTNNWGWFTLNDVVRMGGGSGGGGNAYNVAMTCPDIAGVYYVYFGISDYGASTATNFASFWNVGDAWYWQGTGAASYMNVHIGGNPIDSNQPWLMGNYLARSAVNGLPKNLKGSPAWLWMYHNRNDSIVYPNCMYAMTNALTVEGATNWTARASDTLYVHETIYVLPDSAADWLTDTHGAWTVPDSGTMRVSGFLFTKRFKVALNGYTNGVASLTYSPHVYTVTPVAGISPMVVTVTEGSRTITNTISSATLFDFGNTITAGTVNAATVNIYSGP